VIKVLIGASTLLVGHLTWRNLVKTRSNYPKRYSIWDTAQAEVISEKKATEQKLKAAAAAMSTQLNFIITYLQLNS